MRSSWLIYLAWGPVWLPSASTLTQTHAEMQRIIVYAKTHVQIYHHWQFTPMRTQGDTHTHKRTLSSSSLPLGVNTFFYLADIYRHRINSFPFPCTSPCSCRHSSVDRDDLLDEDGTSASSITKPTDLWQHRWRQSNNGLQQRPIGKLVFQITRSYWPILVVFLCFWVALWHFRYVPQTVSCFTVTVNCVNAKNRKSEKHCQHLPLEKERRVTRREENVNLFRINVEFP